MGFVYVGYIFGFGWKWIVNLLFCRCVFSIVYFCNMDVNWIWCCIFLVLMIKLLLVWFNVSVLGLSWGNVSCSWYIDVNFDLDFRFIIGCSGFGGVFFWWWWVLLSNLFRVLGLIGLLVKCGISISVMLLMVVLRLLRMVCCLLMCLVY